ncbi:MAG: hypothetical protein ACOC3W_05115 [Thermodesulfobacteriota bacterium]
MNDNPVEKIDRRFEQLVFGRFIDPGGGADVRQDDPDLLEKVKEASDLSDTFNRRSYDIVVMPVRSLRQDICALCVRT